MSLADTSVWLDHLRADNRKPRSLLQDADVMTHPFVIGELACGGLRDRDRVLSRLLASPEARTAEHAEVMRFIGGERLNGRGIGWIDALLRASARLAGPFLWTLDTRLAHVAESLSLAFGV